MNLKDWKIICEKIDLVFNSGVNFEKLKEIFEKNPKNRLAKLSKRYSF